MLWYLNRCKPLSFHQLSFHNVFQVRHVLQMLMNSQSICSSFFSRTTVELDWTEPQMGCYFNFQGGRFVFNLKTSNSRSEFCQQQHSLHAAGRHPEPPSPNQHYERKHLSHQEHERFICLILSSLHPLVTSSSLSNLNMYNIMKTLSSFVDFWLLYILLIEIN